MKHRKSKYVLSRCGIAIACASILSIGAAAELSSLPGVQLSDVNFGMSETAFVSTHPAVQKGAEVVNGQQYWLKNDKLYLLDFRLGKLTLVTAAWDKMTSSTQRTVTAQLYQQMKQRYGTPTAAKAGKVFGKGVAEVNAMIFDLSSIAPGIKGILESSELELSLTVFDSAVRPIDKLIFKRDELLANLRKDPLLQHEPLVAPSITDFLDDAGGAINKEATEKPLNDIEAHPDVSSSAQVGPKAAAAEPPTHLPISRSWLLWVLIIIAAIGLLWLVLKKRK